MAAGDYHSLPLPFKVPKRRRTECSHPSPLSDSGLTEDEKDCILALLALSRAPLTHDEEMTPAEEERPPLSPPEVERQSLWLPSPSSSSPPKQQQEVSPISLPSLSQQDQPLPPPPLPEQAPSLALCPVPIRCYRPPLSPSSQPPSPFVSLAPTQQNQARYECPECGKAFSSYQALGGHKTSHRKRPAENSAAASAAVVTTTRATDQNKPYTCSLCHKLFLTGQALGGHMRAHYEGNKRPVAMGIDLNQPATPEAVNSQPAAAAAAATSRPPRLITFF